MTCGDSGIVGVDDDVNVGSDFPVSITDDDDDIGGAKTDLVSFVTPRNKTVGWYVSVMSTVSTSTSSSSSVSITTRRRFGGDDDDDEFRTGENSSPLKTFKKIKQKLVLRCKTLKFIN